MDRQKVVIEIMRAIIRILKKYDDEGKGCEGCRYEYRKEWEYPCVECKKHYTDKYLRRE